MFFLLIQGLGFTTTVVTTTATTTPPPPIPTTTPKPIISQQKCIGSINYCPGKYGALKAVCKSGYCFCTGQDYDYTTCLRKLFYSHNKSGAQMSKAKNKTQSVIIIIQNDEKKFSPCGLYSLDKSKDGVLTETEHQLLTLIWQAKTVHSFHYSRHYCQREVCFFISSVRNLIPPRAF